MAMQISLHILCFIILYCGSEYLPTREAKQWLPQYESIKNVQILQEHVLSLLYNILRPNCAILLI
jgi:hypothetical protein